VSVVPFEIRNHAERKKNQLGETSRAPLVTAREKLSVSKVV